MGPFIPAPSPSRQFVPTGGYNMKTKIQLLLPIAMALAFLATPHVVRAVEICNRAVFPVYISIGYTQPGATELEIQGWFEKQAGECFSLPASADNAYYYYAEPNTSDEIVVELKAQNISWSGDAKDATSLKACLDSSVFHEYLYLNVCTQSKSITYFRRLPTNGNSDYQHHLTYSESEKAAGFAIDTLEDAAAASRGLRGMIIYGRDMGTAPKGVPFRAGIEVEADKHGVYVTKTFAGMPGAAVFQPADRILQIGNVPVKTVYDFLFGLQQLANQHPSHERNEYMKVQFARYDLNNLSNPPRFYESSLDLAYYRDHDLSLTGRQNGEAAFNSLADGVAWGFWPQAYCAGKGAWEIFVEDKPSHQLDSGCVKRRKNERERYRERYASTTQIFDFAGALYSPRLLLKSAAKGSLRKRAMLLAIADEAVQSGITVIGQAPTSAFATAPEIAKGTLVGAGVGAVAMMIFKR